MPPKKSSTCLPQPFISEIAAFQAKNQKIESDLMSLKINYDNLVEESQAAYKTIESLQTQLAERVYIKTEPDDNAGCGFTQKPSGK